MDVVQIAPSLDRVGGREAYICRASSSLLAAGHRTRVLALEGAVPAGLPFDVRSLSGLQPEEKRAAIVHAGASADGEVVVLHDVQAPALIRSLASSRRTVYFLHSFLHDTRKLFRRTDAPCPHRIGARCLLDWYVKPCGLGGLPSKIVRIHRRAVAMVRTLQSVPVLVGSDYARDYLVNEGIDERSVKVVNMADGLPSEKAPGRPAEDGPIELVFVGRVGYEKGVQYILRCLASLDERFKLTIIGGGEYVGRLKQLAEKLGVTGRVDFRGERAGSALDREWARGTVAIAPSLTPETSGLVVPEARSLGLPVVVFDGGSLQEWAGRYEWIYVARHADVDSLRAMIERAAARVPPERSARTNALPQSLASALESVIRC